MTESVVLSITALGSRGEGVARHGDDTVFVAGALPGESVTARIEGKRGILETVDAPSPHRVVPFCPHFGACGGCQVQHLETAAYRAWKRGIAAHALERAGINAEIGEVVDAHGAGRRRATLHATKDRAGFMALRSHDIHAIDHCPILVPGLGDAPAIARAMAAIVGPCDVALTDTAFGPDVAIATKTRVARNARTLALAAERFGVCRVAVNGEVAITHRPPTIEIAGVEVPLPVRSFLQATAQAEEVLGRLVVEAASGAKSVADLFCGIGPFALRLARHAAVHAVDADSDAVAALGRGVRSAKKLKVTTTETRDLFADPMTRFELDRFDTIVLDPPRAGAQAQAREIARAPKVRRVISVSCDPQSFARDAAILIAGGYRLGPVTPVDQFAYSSHLELFAVFDRA